MEQFLSIFSFLFGFCPKELVQDGVTVLVQGQLKPKQGHDFLLHLEQIPFGDQEVQRPQKRLDRGKMHFINLGRQQQANRPNQLSLMSQLHPHGHILDQV